MERFSISNISFHVLNYNNPDRRQRIINRFTSLGLELSFVKTDDTPREFAVFMSHYNMIKDFYDTGKDYGIICEDDIYIKKTIKEDLPLILHTFEHMKLDVLLLGYLLNRNLHTNFNEYPIKPGTYTYHSYDDELWGAQMYLISRKHAKYLLDTYEFDKFKTKYPGSIGVDFVMTKEGNRAMIYPMLAVEEGNVVTDHYGQIEFHKNCFQIQYDSDKYI